MRKSIRLFLCKILILKYVEKSTIDFYISDDKLFILKILKDCRKLKKKNRAATTNYGDYSPYLSIFFS